jgi:hypothetical protein
MRRFAAFTVIALMAATALGQSRYEGPRGSQGTGRDVAIEPRPVAPGRVGQSRYGSSHNRKATDPIGIDRPRFEEVGALGIKVLRDDRLRAIQSGCRIGYFYYDWRWRDDLFGYPYYRFSWDLGAVFSPWYFYPHLPGYVAVTRIRWGESQFDVTWSESRRWDRSDASWRERDALDEAVMDLERGFERHDRRSLGAIVPRRGRVLVDLDRNYRYTIDAADFHDLLVDLAETTRTIAYRVVDVRVRPDAARVTARHDFQDPWGRRQSMTHQFTFIRDRLGYVIAEFAINR